MSITKQLGFIVTSLLLLAPAAVAAEYQGKTIDGKRFEAKVYSVQTGGAYDAVVQFDRQLVTVYFAGGQATLRLTQAVITDPTAIAAIGRLGHVPVGRNFSVGLDFDRSAGNFPSPQVPVRNDIWRISLDPKVLDSEGSSTEPQQPQQPPRE